MVGFLRASFFLVVVVVASCSSPMGPQGEPGPPGPPGQGGTGGACSAPLTTCGAACVDVATDAKNCGACGVVCTDACMGGACCGDGKKNGVEACDKADVGMATCAEAAAPGWTGAPACTASCKLDGKACTTPMTQWNDFTNASNWGVFDTGTVNGGARGFNGSVFDGRYVYLVPHYNGTNHTGLVTRYDTQAGFGAGASWSTFDVSSINGNARGFQHGAFDGRYVYFAPGYNGMQQTGLITRYDTTQPFNQGSSWQAFDVSFLFANARGYHGAVWDGRYMYFVPHSSGAYHGMVVRYDSRAGFGFSGAWSVFDTTTLNPAARGFLGGVYDGRYVYFVPNNGGGPAILTRLDTEKPFGDSAAWSTFDLAPVNPAAKGYYGASFDGRYIYFAPYNNGSTYHGLILRFDTQGTFNDMAAYATFDTTMLVGTARGFISSRFDGRYVYFLPYYNGMYHGVIARYDTTDSFSSMLAWKTFDVGTVSGSARGFFGGAFDGRYLYLTPHYNGTLYSGVVARLDTKSVSWQPKTWLSAQY